MPVDVLRGIDLDVPQGTYLAVEGESGGGKSTLLNVLGLLDASTSGTYEIDAIDAAGLSDREAAARRSEYFGFIFQSFHLLDRRSVVDNVALPLHYRAVGASERRNRALHALAAVGLADFAWHRPRTLSGGQRQRVAIARALASQTPVVLADEPTGNLDSENSADVLRSFERLRDAGTTLIVVTRSETVARHAQQRIRVVDGEITTSRRQGDDSREEAEPADGAAPGEALPLERSSEASRPPGRASSVRFFAALRDACENLASRPVRTLGLVAMVALSLALVVATLGLTGSARAQVSSEFDVVTSRDVSGRIDGNDASQTVNGTLAQTLAAVSGLNGVVSSAVLEDGGTRSIQVGPEREALDATMLRGIGDIPRALRLDVHWADGAPEALSPDHVLVGANLADNLRLAPVDLEPTVDVDGRTVTVVGIIEESPRAADLLGKLIGGAQADVVPLSTVSVFLVTEKGAARHVASELPLAFDPNLPSRVQVEQPVELASVRAGVEESVAMSMSILTIVALIAATASVIIASVTSAGERSEEIGLRRAVGARRTHVSGMLIAESVVLGLIGGTAGTVCGTAAILVVTLLHRWTPVFDPGLGALAIGGGIAIACVGAIGGVIRASRIQPALALRS